jgi:nitroreductase
MVDRDFGDEGKARQDPAPSTPARRTSSWSVCAADAKPTIHDENRDAVAAGVQNLLLGATALGLASFWSTAPLIDSPRALDLCGFAPDDRIVAVIYLGHPHQQRRRRPARPTPPINPPHLTPRGCEP